MDTLAFEIPPRNMGRALSISTGLKPGEFRAYCRDFASCDRAEHSFTQPALFEQHVKTEHKGVVRHTVPKPTKNRPWKAPTQKPFTPAPGDVGSDIVLADGRTAQVWAKHVWAKHVWAVPYNRAPGEYVVDVQVTL